jgi:hypothetical protein
MTCTTCGATRSKSAPPFASCYRCAGGPHRLCPTCAPTHFATHEVRPVGDCPCAPVEGAS